MKKRLDEIRAWYQKEQEIRQEWALVKRTVIHEVGHALVAWQMPGTEVQRIRISQNGGLAEFVIEGFEDRIAWAYCICALSGLATDDIFGYRINSGFIKKDVQNAVESAQKIAKQRHFKESFVWHFGPALSRRSIPFEVRLDLPLSEDLDDILNCSYKIARAVVIARKADIRYTSKILYKRIVKKLNEHDIRDKIWEVVFEKKDLKPFFGPEIKSK